MSSTKTTAKPAISSSTAAADAAPPQTAVLLVQVEALAADDAIRAELKKKGFVLAHQSLAYLSPDDARLFVTHISNPESDVHTKQVSSSEGDLNHPESSRSDVAVIASPRTQTATPRGSKRDEEDAILGLAHGPVLVLALEKAHAVADLQELVGPARPEAWASLPGCLRARLGEDTVRIGVRCTTHESTATAELAFLLTRTQPPSAGHHQQQRMCSELPPKSVDVDLDQLLDFLFPSHVVHPNSTGRLFVFGLYGPLDGHAQLRSGEKGLHVVSDRELDAMSSSMEREDILSVYDMCSLSQHEEEDVLRTVDATLKGFPRYSKRDIETLFAKLPRRANGSLSFHDMQATIMKERCRRVLCMKERVHPALAPPVLNKFRQTLTRMRKTTDEVAPATMFLKGLGFSGAENATLVSRLLSSHSFEICHLDDGNAPELTQNVRLLREQIHKPHETRAPWNGSTISRK